MVVIMGLGAMMDRLRPQDSINYVPPQNAAVDLRLLLGDTTTALPGSNITPIRYPPEPSLFDLPVRPFGPEPRDNGGYLHQYMGAVLKADMAGRPIRIMGTCISACTVYLGARNACVEPGAVLWFHAAHNGDWSKPDSVATEHMASYWPPAVRDWARANGVFETTVFTKRRSLSGQELISMGVKQCG
jgi:hypothetical protein